MKHGITLLLLLFSISLSAQSLLKLDWTKLETSAQGTAEAWGIDVDDQGQIYWATSTDELNQGLDIKCYKFNQQGIELWNQPFVYGGAGTQHAYVARVQDSFLYIGGRNCPLFINSCDMLLVKVDKQTQALQWDKTLNFTADGYDEVDGLDFRPDGIYCGGWAQEFQSNIYQSEMGFWKLDYAGNTIWTEYFGKANTAEHQDGHFVVDDNYIYAAGLWGGTGIGNIYNGQAFLGKFSTTNGAFVDSSLLKHPNQPLGYIENALGMATDGTYLYTTGYITPTSVTDWQIYVAKFDTNLNLIWYTDWGGTGAESARAIVVKDSIIYVAGLTESPTIANSQRDALLLRLDLNGNLIDYGTWGNTLRNSVQDIQVYNEHIYLTGMSKDSADNKEAFLLALAPITISVDPSQDRLTDFTVYPNPAKGQVQLKLNKASAKPLQITATDLSGKLIYQGSIQDQNTIDLEASGLYLIKVDFGKYSISKKVINLGAD